MKNSPTNTNKHQFLSRYKEKAVIMNSECFLTYMFCSGYDMSTFIRRYGRYLNEKAFAYRQMAFDFTRVKKGYVEHGVQRTCACGRLYCFSIQCFHLMSFQRWGRDEDHDHWEAVERHACSADSDRHTPGVRCESDFVLRLDIYLLQTRAASQDRSFSPSFLLSGSSQGAEQWDHQCRISAPLQGPGQNVRVLQRRNHQPIRSVESWRPLAWPLEDVSVDHDESEPVRRLFSQRNTSRWRRATVRRPWRSTRGSWPGWQRSGNSWSWLRWATFNTTS